MSERAPDDESVLPSTRDLTEIIAACDALIPEVRFQSYRLREHVDPRTEEERRHFTEMREDYDVAERALKRLRRYHMKRVKRLEERGTLDQKSFDQVGTIDPLGRATAFTDDNEAPV